MTDSLARNKQIAQASFRLIESGDPALAQRLIAPQFVNHEAADDPEDAARQLPGPAGFLATSAWLRQSFSDLRFAEDETIAEGDTVVVAATMTGTHTGSFQGQPPTGQPIHQRQVHIFHLAAGQIADHRALRDDLGLFMHLRRHAAPG
jgi:predicted ester cyclase